MMLDLKRTWKIYRYCCWHVIRHPGQPIVYHGNPIRVGTQSPVPWSICLVMVFLGVASWCISSKWGIAGLDEAARAMVYIPLSYMFGKSSGLSDVAKQRAKEEG